MNIAIVDDSEDDRAKLANDIIKFEKDNAIMMHISQYKSGEDFLHNALLPSIDVIFLDIYMDDINGMNVARRLRKHNINCQIIFISSTPDYAIQSYQVQAFYYLLKPYKYTDIEDILRLLDKKLGKSSRYIKVKESREWIKVFLDDILYVDYNNHYVQIHTDKAIISTYIKFPEIEEMLLVYSEFLNCYRCIVINMTKIKKAEEFFFLISNGEYIPINRKRAKEIKGYYMDYIFGDMGEVDNDDKSVGIDE